LSPFAALPGDEAVAVSWGRLSAVAHQRGRPRPQNDMWISACCLTHDLPLATLNVKDYRVPRTRATSCPRPRAM